MREIKFRAWNEEICRMFSPEEMGKDELTINPDGRGFVNVSGANTKLSQYYPHMIPLQYTGFKDKNGIEIYEGDIVSCMGHDTANFDSDGNRKEFISYVGWEYGTWYVGAGNYHYTNPVGGLNDRSCKRVEVVGNIYENKEYCEVD